MSWNYSFKKTQKVSRGYCNLNWIYKAKHGHKNFKKSAEKKFVKSPSDEIWIYFENVEIEFGFLGKMGHF